mmetsp:Transcript_14540/g.29543  ORF Transcript_14540/g.29543 Transcript_14540/m.29543 type:complete len:457 (-) Transcript_14540:72-1442(-)
MATNPFRYHGSSKLPPSSSIVAESPRLRTQLLGVISSSITFILLYSLRWASRDTDPPIHMESTLLRGEIKKKSYFPVYRSSISDVEPTLHGILRKDVPSIISSVWNPSQCAVLGLAYGYGLWTFRDFVGSLRATGYNGYIILGISPNPGEDVLDYLEHQNVTVKYVEMANRCTYNGTIGYDGRVINTKDWNCAKKYPDYKITWGRFKLYEDWLKEEVGVTDGIMLTDVRDAYFQRDPFVAAVELDMQHPLMLFEEHPDMKNTHWLTDIPVSSCKKYKVGETQVLCSGSVMGSREGILGYIETMVEEFDLWKTQQNCRIDMPGDDQSIHNYLYYTNRFKNATTIPHRTGPIHVVGYQASLIWNEAEAEGKAKNITVWEVDSYYVRNDKWQDWLPGEHGLIDPTTGLIVNLDGSPSPQVHQVDRFGSLNRQWLRKMNELGWPYNTIPSPSKANSSLLT